MRERERENDEEEREQVVASVTECLASPEIWNPSQNFPRYSIGSPHRIYILALGCHREVNYLTIFAMGVPK